MRKYIYLFLFLIISLGCTGEMDHVSNTETSNTQSIDQHGKSNDESGVLLFDAKNVIRYGDSQTQKEHPVTIIKVEDGYRAYRNQNLDFSNLTLEVTAFDLYWSLWRIPDNMKRNNMDDVKIVSVQEDITRVMFAKWERFDVDYAI